MSITAVYAGSISNYFLFELYPRCKCMLCIASFKNVLKLFPSIILVLVKLLTNVSYTNTHDKQHRSLQTCFQINQQL